MLTEQKKTTYDSVDLVKFIACFLVVALHSDVLLDVSKQANTFVCGGIARLAVPVFFVATAFFYFQKEQTAESLKKYCWRMGKLYLCWFIVSFPKTIFDRFVCSKFPMGETVFRFVRSFFVTSTFSGSWFIVSCVFCAILFFYLDKLPAGKRQVITIILCILAYGLAVFGSGYGKLIAQWNLKQPYKIYTLLFAYPYNNIFTGIPYFALGRYLTKHHKVNEQQSCFWLACGSIVAVLLLLLEVWLTHYYKVCKATDCYLMLFPCVYVLFPLILQWKIKLKHAKLLRVTSTIVFFSHFLWLFMAELIEYVAKITIPQAGKFLLAVVGCLLTTWIILRLQKCRHWEWLRYFY